MRRERARERARCCVGTGAPCLPRESRAPGLTGIERPSAQQTSPRAGWHPAVAVSPKDRTAARSHGPAAQGSHPRAAQPCRPRGPAQTHSEISASRSPRPGFCTSRSATAPLKAVLSSRRRAAADSSPGPRTGCLCPGSPAGCFHGSCPGTRCRNSGRPLSPQPHGFS